MKGSLAIDEELVRRVVAREPGAETELVLRFEPGLRAIATIRAGRDTAGDVVQETLAVAIANLRGGSWRGEGPLACYLAGILRHQASRVLADAHLSLDERQGRIPSSEASPESAAAERERRTRLRRALARLPADRREVLLRHYFEGSSAEEIARALGIPRGTVLSRLHYARLALARLLGFESLRGSTALVARRKSAGCATLRAGALLWGVTLPW